jgi:hypothetical protein
MSRSRRCGHRLMSLQPLPDQQQNSLLKGQNNTLKLMNRMWTHRSQRTTTTAKLTVNYNGSIGGRPHDNANEITEVGKVWRSFCCDRNTVVLQFHAISCLARCHYVFYNHNIVFRDFLPNRNNSSISRFSMQQNPGCYFRKRVMNPVVLITFHGKF